MITGGASGVTVPVERPVEVTVADGVNDGGATVGERVACVAVGVGRDCRK